MFNEIRHCCIGGENHLLFEQFAAIFFYLSYYNYSEYQTINGVIAEASFLTWDLFGREHPRTATYRG